MKYIEWLLTILLKVKIVSDILDHLSKHYKDVITIFDKTMPMSL
jgi:hypothetical protein